MRNCSSALVRISPRHINAVPSSSTRNPIDTTLSSPASPAPSTFGTSIVWGVILPSVPPRRPSTPSMRGTLKPQMSASRTPTVSPLDASAAARLTVTDDLPTPPLPLATAITRVVEGTSVGAAFSRAFQRARCIAAVFCSGVISPYSTATAVTPGSPRTFDSTSCLICVRSGQPAVVRATRTVTAPSGSTRMSSTMPSSTMSACSSGSMTPRSMPRTSSGAGGGPAMGSWTGAPGSSGFGTVRGIGLN